MDTAAMEMAVGSWQQLLDVLDGSGQVVYLADDHSGGGSDHGHCRRRWTRLSPGRNCSVDSLKESAYSTRANWSG